MALLDEKTRIEYLRELGYGSVKDFQRAVMYQKWVDGIYGQQTDNALRTAINVKRFTRNFTTKEFMCECGGKYCGGYPDYMKPEVLKNIQAIRDHWGRPVTITCGLRDKTYNSKLGGSIQNSLHLCGQAVDFYQAGVTDTLAHRKSSIRWIKTLPNHHYTYGNGINSYGNGVSAPYMGNALHTDVSISVSPYDDNGKLICDGIAGEATIKRAQQVFGTAQDGVASGQTQALIKKYCPSLKAVAYNRVKSTLVKRIQKWAGTTQDGVWGKGTSIAVQNKLNSEGYNCGKADGIFGKSSMSAFQRWLNDHNSPTPDTPTPQPTPAPSYLDKWFNALKTQYNWSKNQKYEWVSGGPTIANSKKKGTCISLHSVALQRLGILPSKGYFYFNPKTKKIAGKSAGYVKSHPEIFKVFYPNKTVKQLWKEGLLKIGDYVGYGGSDYHSMVFKGFNKNGDPIFDTMGHRRGLNITYPHYAKKKVGMVVRLLKV